MITENEELYKPKHLVEDDNRPLSQLDMLAEHLINNGSITSLEAIELYGCTRLSARIWDLRHKLELPIVGRPESGKNRFGKTVNYIRYSLGGTA